MLINSPNISGSLKVTGNTVITGSLTVLGGINATITGSATSASYVEYSNVANKPALVSGSSQITYSGLSGIPADIVSGSSQISFNGIVDKPTLVSGSEQVSFNGITDKPTLVSGSSQVTYSGLSGIPSGIVSSSTQITGYNIFATTGSNSFNGSQVVTGSLTVTGQVVAQTLNVQQVTSSIVYSSGSNVFGNNVSNTQQFTGSLQVSGSSHYVLGNVGMGTTTPSGKLHLSSTGDTYLVMTGGASPRTFSWLVDATNLRLFSGVGDTTLLTIDPTGTSTFTGTSASPVLTLSNSTGGTKADFTITENTGLIVNSYESTSARSIDFRVAGTSALLIASTGAATFSSSVGIGIAPSQQLTIGGQASAQMTLRSSTTTGSSEIYFGDSAAVYRGYIGYQHDGDYFQFATAASERMRISSGGNVSIGNTNNTYKLDVSGQVKSTQYLIAPDGTNNVYNFVDATNTYTGLYTLQAGGGSAGYGGSISMFGHSHATKPGYVNIGISVGSGGKFTVTDQGNASGTEVFTVQQNGNVGIGTAGPTSELEISKEQSTGPVLKLTNPTTNNTSQDLGVLGFVSGDLSTSQGNLIRASVKGIAGELAYGTGGQLVFSTMQTYAGSGTLTDLIERMRITSDGNVGIGTTPAYKLDVYSSTSPATIGLKSDGTYNSIIRDYHTSSTSTFLDITTERTDGGGFNFLLLVSSTLTASAANRNYYTFAVQGRGTTATATQLSNVSAGTSSRTAIAVSFPSNGVIRLTLTGGEDCQIKVTAIGHGSL